MIPALIIMDEFVMTSSEQGVCLLVLTCVRWLDGSLMVCVFHPATAVELTVETALQAVKEVENWWGIGRLGFWLNVPESVQDEIRRRHSTVASQKEALISYWLTVDPTPSWRRLIHALNDIEAHSVSEKIHNRAEPVTGRSCLWWI